MEGATRLARDAVAALALAAKLGSSGLDDRRVAAIVAGAPGCELLLPYTVPGVLRGVEAAGRSADLVVGFNDGLRSAALLAELAAQPDAELVQLAARADGSVVDERGRPAVLTASRGARHRLIAVHRYVPAAVGKTYFLAAVLGGLFGPSIDAGWQPPALLLLFDADSLFFRDPRPPPFTYHHDAVRGLLAAHVGDVGAVIAAIAADAPPVPRSPLRPLELVTPGLPPLIDALDDDPALDLVGARPLFCAFTVPRKLNSLP